MKEQKRFTKVDKLFKEKKQFTRDDFDSLSKEEQKYFDRLLDKLGNELKGEELAKFWHQIDLIIDSNTRNQSWEYNHNKITFAISSLLQDYGRMPSITEISTKSELSRQTVYKHLKEYNTNALFIEQREQFKFMACKVLARVYYYAVNGDTNAAKLYLNIVGFGSQGLQAKSSMIQNLQKNFIQINGYVFTEDMVRNLPESMVTQLAEIASKNQLLLTETKNLI